MQFTQSIALAAQALVLAVTFTADLGAETDGKHQPRPNIVFIYADDWRWDCLGVVQREQGDTARFPWLQTPRLDKLAEESVRFRQSFVVNSLCSPGRACVLTSRYSHLNGIIGNSQPLPTETANFAKQLQQAGYTTGYCGKFHMGSQRERAGFDYVASFIGQGRYNNCPIIFNGQQTETHGWIDDVSTDYAINYIEESKNKPFFLWLGFKSPHGPRGGENLPERARGLYANDEPRDVPNLDVPAVFNVQAETRARQPAAKNRRSQGIRAYMRHITAIDHCVGRVIDALEKNGQLDNTAIIVASDNGYYLGEHQLGDKRSAYDESLRVPLVIRLPGNNTRRGTTNDSIALNIDYAPTILELAAATPLPEAQGRSLMPLLNGTAPADWRSSFFYEYFKEPRYTSPTVLALRTATHKLITYPGHDEWTEVFDLKHDPYELENLADNAKLRAELRQQFDAESEAVRFRMPKLPDALDQPAEKRDRKISRPNG